MPDTRHLLLATRNEHKLREFARLLEPAGIAVSPLPGEIELPPEDGATFAENALPKARTAAHETGEIAIADDSGIEVEALGGAPGVRSARYAGPSATDKANLEKLMREAPAGSALRYVCVIAYVDPRDGKERLFYGECRGRLAGAARGTRGFGYDPAFVPEDEPRDRTMAELSDREKDAISHRGRAARALAEWLRSPEAGRSAGAPEPPREAGNTSPRSVTTDGGKLRAAALSVISNSVLILLKAIAASVTGSVSILTEAVHSSVDLVASIVAFGSVRKAGEPADETHRYGHEKIENLSAAIEGMLILVGSAVIAFEAIRRLVVGGHLESIRLGWVVIGISLVANVVVSTVIARRAKAAASPALAGDAAHLRTDALTSAAVLVGLVLVKVTGAQWLDPAVALAVACVILITGVRVLTTASQVLVDTSLPRNEVDEIRHVVETFAPRGVVGYHELRTRMAGNRRYVDLHLQFQAGTSLEDAHRTAHEVQEEIAARLPRTDVLIHLEPEDRVRPGERLQRPARHNFRTG